MLKFKTEGQELIYLDNGTVIVGGTVRYLEAQFDFDEDWRGYSEVTAFFKNGAAVYPMDVSDGKISAEDNLALEAGAWSVYLKASNYDEDGGKVIKQITSTTVRLNVLCHGKHDGTEFPDEPASIWEQAFNKINVAENGRVEAENERKTAEEARCVFEEYNPLKEYVKGNKVAFDGSSYVLTADSSKGVNPTDSEVWLLIAEKGDNGEQGEKGEKGADGKDGKDGKDGTLWIPFKFDVDIKKGENKRAEFDFSRNIFKFGDKTYDDLDKNDFPNLYEWAVGDFFVSNNGNVLRITRLERLNSETLNFDAECIFEFTDIVVDESYNPSSNNPISGRAIGEVLVAVDIYKANTDLSNVSDEDFKAKAEAAGVGGDAGLTEEKCIMEFMGVVTELPDDAEEGQVYKRYGYITEYVGWAFESYDNTFKIYPDRIEFGTCTDIFAEVSNYLSKENGAMVNLKLHNYDTGEMHDINATKAENNILYGTTDVENNYVVGSGAMEFIREGPVNKTYVRFNGEWVEL